jgi:hypothetical protein
MDLKDTNTRKQKIMHCNNCDGYPHHDKIITNESTNVDNSDLHPQSNRKQQLSCDNEDELYVPAPKKFKASDAHHRIAIIIPTMAKRLQHNINTYSGWRRNGFDVVLVFNKDEEKAITNILHQHAPDMISSVMRSYTMNSPPNAGIAKHEAYRILQEYLNQPDFQFALLLDDTVNKIINTRTGKSIMTTPIEFYHAVKKFAQESLIFGGTVAYKRHPKKCKQKGIATVKGSFLQQALIFSCRGASTLEKHFKDVDEYIAKMGMLGYRRVPFGEDVAFQVALYEHGVLSRKKSPQFWGIGISRIHHESSTKPSFDQLKEKTKKELKKMLIYLKKQNALSVNPKINKLRGVKVIPRGRIRIRITGSKGERPWREAFNYTFPCSQRE